MNKTIFVGVLMLMMLAIGVSASDCPTNATFCDNFNRGNSSLVGNFTMPSNLSWNEIQYPTEAEGDWATYSIANNTLYWDTLTNDSGLFLSVLTPMDYRNFTIEFDAKVIDIPSNTEHINFAIGDSDGFNRTTYTWFSFEWVDDDGVTPHFACYGNMGNITGVYNSSIYDGGWHHYRIDTLRHDNTTQLYIDGNLTCDVPYTDEWLSGSGFINTITINSYWAGGWQVYLDNFTGYTTGIAPPCIPNWNCTGYGACINSTQVCNSTADINLCGENYTGNFSEFTPQNCTIPGHYISKYRVEDMPVMFIDFIGTVPAQFIGMGIINLLMMGVMLILISSIIIGGIKFLIQKIEGK